MSQESNGTIYLIRNIVNGKIYVGLTRKELSLRWSSHKHDARNPKRANTRLHGAMRKHGIENFTIEVLETAPIEQLPEAEIRWIAQLDSTNRAVGYNISEGGTCPSHSPETRAKLSASIKAGCQRGEGHYLYGKTLSEETRKKIGDAQRGKKRGPRSPESTRKTADALRGRTVSEEQKQKISATLKGRKLSPEARENFLAHVETRRGVPVGPRSDEVRQKISEAHKGKPWTEAHRRGFEETKKRWELEPRPHNPRMAKSQEHREKISASRKGKGTGKRAAEVGQKVSASKKGVPWSEETRRKYAERKAAGIPRYKNGKKKATTTDCGNENEGNE